MRKFVVLTHDFPTVEEVARLGGVSPERMNELVRMAEEDFANDTAYHKKQGSGRHAKSATAVKKRRKAGSKRK